MAVTQSQLRDGEKDTAPGLSLAPAPGRAFGGILGKAKVSRDFHCSQAACLQPSGAHGPRRKQPLKAKDSDHDSCVHPNSSTDLGLWVEINNHK